MKKVAILIYSLDAGGAEKVVSLLLPQLQQNFDVTLVLMNRTIKYDLQGFNKIYYLEDSSPTESGILKFLKLPLLAYKYALFCKKNRIDISLSLLSRPNFIALLSKYFTNKSKLIICEHSLLSKQYENFNFQSVINKILIRLLYKRSDAIISVSNGVKDDLISNFNIENTITTINNPLDLHMIDKIRDEKVDFKFDKYTFITIGRLDTAKNHELLIKSFHRIDNSNCQLIIIGTGILENHLKNLVTELSLEKKIFLIGHVANPYAWLSKSSCFLLSSNYESFGIVLIEALACSLPIISTNCKNGPKEILSPNNNIEQDLNDSAIIAEYGILTVVDSQDSMIKAMNIILNNKDLSDAYANKARIRARSFDKNKIIPQYIKVLNESL